MIKRNRRNRCFRADIGLIGLAVMGQNLILNMNDHGFTVKLIETLIFEDNDRICRCRSRVSIELYRKLIIS